MPDIIKQKKQEEQTQQEQPKRQYNQEQQKRLDEAKSYSQQKQAERMNNTVRQSQNIYNATSRNANTVINNQPTDAYNPADYLQYLRSIPSASISNDNIDSLRYIGNRQAFALGTGATGARNYINAATDASRKNTDLVRNAGTANDRGLLGSGETRDKPLTEKERLDLAIARINDSSLMPNGDQMKGEYNIIQKRINDLNAEIENLNQQKDVQLKRSNTDVVLGRGANSEAEAAWWELDNQANEAKREIDSLNKTLENYRWYANMERKLRNTLTPEEYAVVMKAPDMSMGERTLRGYAPGLYATNKEDVNSHYISAEGEKIIRDKLGKDAKDALEYIERVRNAEVMNATTKAVQDFTLQNGLSGTAASIATVPANLLGSLAATGNLGLQVAQDMFNGRPIDYNNPGMQIAVASQDARNAVLESIEKTDAPAWLKKTGQIAYSTGMSMADSLAAMATFGEAGGTLLGMSAGVQGVREAKKQGLSDAQAILTGIMNGAFEMLFETLSIEKLINLKSAQSFKQAFKNALAQGGIEASEEVFTTLGNTFYDLTTNGGYNLLDAWQKYHVDQKLSASDAAQAIWNDTKDDLAEWFIGLAEDAVGGFLSGAIMGGGQQFRQDSGNLKTGNAIFKAGTQQQVANLIRTTEALEGNPVLLDLVEKLEQGKVTPRQVGLLFNETMQGMQEIAQRNDATGDAAKEQIKLLEGLMQASATDAKASRQSKAEQPSEQRRTAVQEWQEAAQKRDGLVAPTAKEVSGIATITDEDGMVSRRVVTGVENGENGAVATTVDVDENGKVVPGTESTTALNSLQFDDETRQELHRNAVDMKLNAEDYGYYTNGYNAEAFDSVEEYDAAFRQAAEMAWTAEMTNPGDLIRFKDMLNRNSSRFANMSNQTLLAAMRMGDAMSESMPQQLASNKIGEVDESRVSGATRSRLAGTREYRAVKGLARLLSLSGVRVGFYESQVGEDGRYFRTDKNGNVVRDDGYYDPNTKTIWIDVNSGRVKAGDTQNTMLWTLGHEMTHFIKDNVSAEMYGRLQNFVKDHMGDAWETSVSRYEDKGYSREEAEEEVVCEACSNILTNSRMVSMLRAADNELFAKITKFVYKLLGDIDAAFDKYFKEYPGRLPKEARDMLEFRAELASVWDDAFNEALTNLKNVNIDSLEHNQPLPVRHALKEYSESLGIEAKRDEKGIIHFTYDGKEIDAVTEKHVKNSEIGTLISYTVSNGFITQEEADKQYKGVADLMNMILSTNSPEEIWAYAGASLFSAVKKNSDGQYQTTVDFTTVCRKTQDMITAMSEAMMKRGKGLTKAEVTELQKRLIEADLNVPCPVCYVFSRWAGAGGILDGIAKLQEKYGNMSHEDVLRTIDEFKRLAQKLDIQLMKKDGTLRSLSKKEVGEVVKAKDFDNAALDALLAAHSNDVADVEAQLEAKRDLRDRMGKKLDSDTLKALRKDIDDLQKKLNKLKENDDFLQEWTWLANVMSREDYRPVPNNVLYNLDDGATFAEQYAAVWKYRTTRGSGAGKAIVPYADFRFGDLINGADKPGDTTFSEVKNGEFNDEQKKAIISAIARAKAQNLIGGQRYQSTSDFRYEYALDYFQSFLEAQALGMSIQSYTKIVEFAQMLASVGGDVNCSVMPKGRGYDANGVLQFSSVTGMDYDAAALANSRYDSVQLILVGINDEHIRIALEDDIRTRGATIGQVIPYHSSGASIEEFISELVRNLGEEYVKGNYTSYEDVQNDRNRKNITSEQKNLQFVRTHILTGNKPYIDAKGDKKTERNAKFTADELDLIRGENANIKGRSFEDLLAVERRALEGDANAIEEYLSWSAGVLYNTYQKLWEGNGEYKGVRLNSSQAEHIMPHEFWDTNTTRANAYVNNFIFRSYCYRLGLVPRFTGEYGSYVIREKVGKKNVFRNAREGELAPKDFTTSRGYWKTLIDRAMYANDGSYRAQQKINVTDFNNNMLNPEYGKSEWGQFTVKDSNRARAIEVGRKFANDLKKAERHREKEEVYSDYSNAIKRGASKEELSKLVVEAAILNGYSVFGYHGTGSFGFTVPRAHMFISSDPRVSASYLSPGASIEPTEIAWQRDLKKRIERMTPKQLFKEATKIMPRLLTARFLTGEEANNILAYKLYDTLDELEEYREKANELLQQRTYENLSPESRDVVRRYLRAISSLSVGSDFSAIAQIEKEAKSSKNPEVTNAFMDARYNVANGSLIRFIEKLGEAAKYQEAEAAGTPIAYAPSSDFVWTLSELKDRLLDTNNKEGIYSIAAKPNNMFVVEGNGADWTSLAFVPPELERLKNEYLDAQSRNASQEELNRISQEFDDYNKYLEDNYSISDVFDTATDEIKNWAFDNGYDAVKFRDIVDLGDPSQFGDIASDVYVFKVRNNPNGIVKSLDPITYDDDGNVIPLSERFDEKRPDRDMRYRLKEDVNLQATITPNTVLRENVDYKGLSTDTKSQVDKYVSTLTKVQKALKTAQDMRNTLRKTAAYRKLNAANRQNRDANATALTVDEARTLYQMADMLDTVEVGLLKDLISLEKMGAGVLKGIVNDNAAAFAAEQREQYKLSKMALHDLMAQTRQQYGERIERERLQTEYWHQRYSEIRSENQRRNAIRDIREMTDRLRQSLNAPAGKAKKTLVYPIQRTIAEGLVSLTNALTTEKGKGGREYTNRMLAIARKLANLSYSERELEQFKIYGIDELVDKVKTEMNDVANALENQDIRDVSNESLSAIRRTLRDVSKSINLINDTIATNREQRVNDLIAETKETLSKLPDAKTNDLGQEKESKVLRHLDAYSKTPVFFLDRFGEAGKTLFKMLAGGDASMMRKLRSLEVFISERLGQEWTSKNIRKWEKQTTTLEIEDEDGNTSEVKLMPVQYLTLYMYAKQPDSRAAILKDGFKPKGSRSAAYQISEESLDAVTEQFAKEYPEMAKIADGMAEFLKRVAGWGNEVTSRVYGTYEFMVEEYFPLVRVMNAQERENAKNDKGVHIYDPSVNGFGNAASMLAYGERQNRMVNSDKAVELGNAFDLFVGHCANMALFNGYFEALNTMDKWAKANGDLIEQKYGAATAIYIQNLLNDVAMNKTNERTDFVDKLVSFTRLGMIFGNLSSMLIQPTSYFRAMGEMNWGSLGLGFPSTMSRMRFKQNAAEAETLSGIAIRKSMGFYNTGTAIPMRQRLKYGEFDWRGHPLSAMHQVGVMGMEKMDRWTWAVLWQACKNQVANEFRNDPATRDAKIDKNNILNSDIRYQEAVTALFDDTVYRTQVVDSTITRSDVMRRKDLFWRLASAFMMEGTLTYNNLMSAVTDINFAKQTNDKAAERVAVKKAGARFAAFLTTAAVANFVRTLVSALRRRKPEEKYEDAFKRLWWPNFLWNEINPLGMLPWFNDIASKLQGYDFTPTDMQAISDSIDFLKLAYQWIQVASGKKKKSDTDIGKLTAYGTVLKAINVLGEWSGANIKNAVRDFVSAYNLAVFEGWVGGKQILEYETSAYASAESLYKAQVDGDEELAKRIIADSEKNGIDLASIQKQEKDVIKNDYISGNIDEDEAERRLVDFLGYDENAVGKENPKYVVDSWTYKRETANDENAEDYTLYGEMKEAVKSGDADAIQAEKEQLIRDYKLEEKNVDKEIRTDIYDALADGMDRDKAIELLEMYGGNTEATGANSLQAKVDAAASGDEEFSIYDNLDAAIADMNAKQVADEVEKLQKAYGMTDSTAKSSVKKGVVTYMENNPYDINKIVAIIEETGLWKKDPEKLAADWEKALKSN